MKTEITLFSSPQTFFTRYPIASRILTTNLLREPRFKVNYTDTIPLMSYTKSLAKMGSDYRPILERLDETYSTYARWWCGYTTFGRFPIFYTFTGALDKDILAKLPSETILFTAYTILDIRVVKTLLNDKRKVVLGGSATFIYTPEMIRAYLIKMGIPKDITEKNLIIVQGYVDLKTDLYKIISDWKDTEIVENDFSTFWDCTEDNFMNHVKIYKQLFNTGINALLTSTCWWGKCSFCTYTCFPKYNFAENTTTDKLADYFREISRKYESKNIFFNDSYLIDSEYNRDLFQKLSKENYEMSFYTGVLLVKRPKYIEFLNSNSVDRIYIGIETTNNFSLNYINKGYSRKEIIEMVENMKKYMNKSVTPVFLTMVDLPVDAVNENDAINQIRDNYKFLYDIRQDLASAGIGKGIGCQFSLAPLRHFPKTDLIDDKYLKAGDPHSNNLIGVFRMYKYLNEKLGINIDEIYNSACLSEPMTRHLSNGEILQPDMVYADKEIIEDLVQWKFPQ